MNRRTMVIVTLAAGCMVAPAGAQQRDSLRMQIGQNPRSWAGLGGQLRERVEGWDGFNFSTPASADNQDAFLLTRLLVHGQLVVADRLQFYVEGKSSLATKRSLVGGQRTADVDELALQQAWAELRTVGRRGSLAVRAGRQDLALGRERLISPLDWTNTRRTFEGVVVRGRGGRGGLQAFLLRPVRVRQYAANKGDTTQWFAGLYGTRTVRRGAVDLYVLRNVNDAASFNGTSGREERTTLGGRATMRGRGGRLDAEVEAAWQFGTVGSQDIRASMFTAEIGLNVPDMTGTPRFYLGYDFASGDNAPGGQVGTFNQLYPLAHAHLGYIDVHGRQNVVDLRGGVRAQGHGATVAVDLHRFYRQNVSDALYGVAGTVARGPGVGLSASTGSEVDLTVRRGFGRRFTGQAGYSRYFAGAFIEAVPPATDIAFGYVQLTAAF